MNMFSKKAKLRRIGFTLVELLAVVAIIGILVAITIPAVQSVRGIAQKSKCSNKLRQIALANSQFVTVHEHFPSGINAYDDPNYPSRSWLTCVLPYLEQSSLHARSETEYQSSASPFLHATIQQVVQAYACPSDNRALKPQYTHENRLVGLTSFVGVAGLNYQSFDGVLYLNSNTRPTDISDGLSNTFLAGERPPSSDFWYGWWYAGAGQDLSGSPDMILGVAEINNGARFAEACPSGPYTFKKGKLTEQCDVFHFWSLHPNGANFVMCDASVHFVNYGIDSSIMKALASRKGGEIETIDP